MPLHVSLQIRAYVLVNSCLRASNCVHVGFSVHMLSSACALVHVFVFLCFSASAFEYAIVRDCLRLSHCVCVSLHLRRFI